jgi:invasion protein IalB
MLLNKKPSIAIAAALLGLTFSAYANDRGSPVPAGLMPAIQTAQATIPAAPASPSAAPAAPASAPGLSEAFESWSVNCVQKDPAKRCGVSQTQVAKNGQRLLAIEFPTPSGDALTGILVLPFGLSLEAGVNLQIDGRAIGKPLRFQTCLPVGCIVPLNFDATTVAFLRGAKTLEVKSVADGGEAGSFTVSLQGFSAALTRLVQLGR